ncbi:ubiquitin-conjugating enzyme E2 [Lignipirellula cremea]|uniref:Ubiquitin-conjugating enzyme n=1 Tax=Lignipirellula cremea TaxID=2528010 RepID=A0A518DSR9_9BACT|nr:ubiquitin-conjugating enzyme E2 [Lignipirellula cremea]QDU94886.1 Ubiquitin-conjugating enzyme [Lignipirellula cremea]
METTARNDRLTSDLAAVRKLHRMSSLFEFETAGSPPDRYAITFRGKGVRPASGSRTAGELADLHRVDVRLPQSYPDRPPDIRWITPLFHPNVSFGGFLDLQHAGLPWEADLTLDIVVERLWDVLRLAYFDLDLATNFTARQWYLDGCALRLPTDLRPLRDKAPVVSENIIRYDRKGSEPRQGPVSRATIEIDESTPLAPPVVPLPPRPELFYIGDEPPEAASASGMQMDSMVEVNQVRAARPEIDLDPAPEATAPAADETTSATRSVDSPAAESGPPAGSSSDNDDDILYIGWD